MSATIGAGNGTVNHPNRPGRQGEGNLERRFYFLAGDVLANALTGMAAAWLASALVEPTWSMAAGMLAGMFAAMGLAFLLMPVLVGLFGAMEVMLPVMLTAMVAGMVYGMAGTMPAAPALQIVPGGAALGLLVLLFTYAVDAWLQRRQP